MPLLQRFSPRHLLYLLLVMHGGAALLCLIYPPALGMDIFQGFEALQGYTQYHTPFHHVLKLAYHNIAENRAFFMSYFSPGHYLLPYALSRTCICTLASATIFSNYLCFVAGLAGFYQLYKHFGFGRGPVALSLLIISFQLYTTEYYYTCSTADIYLFAYVPWLLLGFLKQGNWRWFHFPLLIAAYLLGFVLKTSFLLVALPLIFLAPVYQVLFTEGRDRTQAIATIAGNATAYAITFGLCHYFFNRHGEHSGYAREVSFYLVDIALTLSGPLTSAFSADKWIDIMANSHLHEGRVEGTLAVFYYLMALPSVALLIYYAARAGQSRYHLVWLLYSTAIIGLTYLLQLTNSGIDTNSRIYFLSGFLLLPQLAKWVLQNSRWVKAFALTVITALLVSMNYAVLQKKIFIHQQYPQGPVTGFKYEYLQNDRALMPLLLTLDQAATGSNSVVILPTFGPSLDMKNLRAVTYYERWNLKWWLEQEPLYHGTVAHLYIVSYKHLSTETMPLYLSRFTGYTGYRKISETEAFNVFELTSGQ